MRDLILPGDTSVLTGLSAGTAVLLSGRVAVARDAAHKIMCETDSVPFDPSKTPVFYAGPSPAPPGYPCGSCGPTTSSRMERFIPFMLNRGMKIAMGKGDMSAETRKLFMKHGAVYLAAVGGAAALAASRITRRKVVAWEHLGPEAAALLTLDRFPVFVAWDLKGGNIFSRNEDSNDSV